MKRLFRNIVLGSLLAAGTLTVLPSPFHTARAALVVRPGPGRPDLTRLTVAQLRQLATRLKIPGRSKARRKADLITLINSAL